jgi:flagellar hook protein FlgE
MFSGVSGLRVHQTRMDVIGNNIANVNTTGYKSQRVTFNEVFSQTLQGASSASDETGRGGLNPMQVGLGVNVSSIDMLMTQGAAQRTDNPFDLMINGEGFIVVGDATGKYFTRAGALRQDDQGNLIIPNGMKVMGWPASEDAKSIERSEVEPLKLNDPALKSTAPQPTQSASFTGNLNTDDGIKGIETQIKMYDTLGNYYTLNMKLTYDTATSAWTLAPIAPSAANYPTGTTMTNAELVDQNGKRFLTNLATTGLNSIKFDNSGKLDMGAMPTSFKINEINLSVLAPEGRNSLISPGNGLTVDFSTLTQYASKSTVEGKALDGKAAGKMSGYDIGNDGIITAYYDNGDRRLLGQVVVAQFDNPAGLEKAGDNLFAVTANSGDFDNIGQVGNFQAGVLEMSNVDLSKEFTEMIITQRGFQANSRIISVSDEMLQELTNLKR